MSLVIGLVNAILAAVPQVMEVPYAVLTVGLSALLVNAALLGIVALLSPSVRVDSVRAAVVGGMVISVGHRAARAAAAGSRATLRESL